MRKASATNATATPLVFEMSSLKRLGEEDMEKQQQEAAMETCFECKLQGWIFFFKSLLECRSFHVSSHGCPKMDEQEAVVHI